MMSACICGTAGRTVTSSCRAATTAGAEKRGDRRSSAPAISAATIIEVRPNTCVIGSTPRITSDGTIPRVRAEAPPPNIRFAWVSITPLGVPVVPVVYRITAVWPGSVRTASAADARRASVMCSGPSGVAQGAAAASLA